MPMLFLAMDEDGVEVIVVFDEVSEVGTCFMVYVRMGNKKPFFRLFIYCIDVCCACTGG
jgi:hypothetical protein